MFYEYDQNNSGGSFELTENLGKHVWIEADSQELANYRAVQIGIYFDGVEKGYDCECCGDRWYEPWGSRHGAETLAELVEPHREFQKRWPARWDGNRIGVVHYKDGRRANVWYDDDTWDAHEVKELEA